MNIKRFVINSILGLILFNGISLLLATIMREPFRINVLINVITPILAGFASGLALTPEERANHL